MGKYFYDKNIKELSVKDREKIFELQKENQQARIDNTDMVEELNKSIVEEILSDSTLKAAPNRVLILIDTNGKNWHTLDGGIKIRLERGIDNFDKKYTQPVNAMCIDGDGVPKGAEILVHHNSSHDTNRIFNYNKLSSQNTASTVNVYSIPIEECFLWRINGGEWQPMKGFVIAERVFKPYMGLLHGIEPTQIKNVLYIKTGELKGNIVHTLKSCDYPIIFQDTNGKENTVIRCRHYEGTGTPLIKKTKGNISCELINANAEPPHEREEILAINHDLTEQLNKGKLLIGISTSKCKPLTETLDYAD